MLRKHPSCSLNSYRFSYNYFPKLHVTGQNTTENSPHGAGDNLKAPETSSSTHVWITEYSMNSTCSPALSAAIHERVNGQESYSHTYYIYL